MTIVPEPAETVPGAPGAGGRSILVVATIEHPETLLRRYVGEGDVIKVVVPVVRQGVLDWLANDEKAFARAERTAHEAAEALPGEAVTAAAGEADIDLAVRDALATFPADEIVLALRVEDVPDGSAGESATRMFEGVPVRRIVIAEE